MNQSKMGYKRWAFSAGWIPPRSTGSEPEFTSRDVLCLLNTAANEACVQVTIYHEDKDPIGEYELLLPAVRVQHIRINDLINPEPVPLGSPYGVVLVSDEPIIAQMAHFDTRENRLSTSIYSGIPDTEYGNGADQR